MIWLRTHACAEKCKIRLNDLYSKGKYTCRDCSNKNRKITTFEKYGVDNVFKVKKHFEKYTNTMLKKYGVYNPQQIIASKLRTKKLVIKNMDVLKNPSIQRRIKRTNLKTHGVEYPMQSKKYSINQDKLLKKNGVEYPAQI